MQLKQYNLKAFEKRSYLALIPIILSAYILIANFSALGDTQEFKVNLGGEDDTSTNRAYLWGPSERISERIVGSPSYRNITASGVYFESDIQTISVTNNSEVRFRIRFRDEVPDGGRVVIGAKDASDWSYDWNTVSSNYQHLKDTRSASSGKRQVDGRWITASTSWKMNELYREDNKLNFIIKAQYLNQEKYANRSLPVDWVEITVEQPPLQERMK